MRGGTTLDVRFISKGVAPARDVTSEGKGLSSPSADACSSCFLGVWEMREFVAT